MAHGEEFSNTIQVSVDGTPLPADVAPLLMGGYVDDSTNVPDMVVLRFSDAAGIVLAKGKFAIGAKIDLKVQATEPSGLTPLLEAEVTALEVEVGEKGTYTVVRGLDVSHRLFRGTHTVSYLNVSASDIVTQVARRAGLRCKVDSTPARLEHTTQDGVNDWDFLRRLAAENDRVLYLSNGVLEFVRRTAAAEAPGSRDSRADPLVLEAGVSLVHLRGTVTSAGQVPSVEVRGWDPKAKRVVTSKKDAATTSASITGMTPATIAQKFGSATHVLGLANAQTQGQVEAIATSLSDHVAGGFAEIDGTAKGNPQLRAGAAVTLVGVGQVFSGKFVLSSTRHEFSADYGYRTSFTASNTSERSLYGATNASVRERHRVPGVVPAIVTNVNDPDKEGRVKVKLPWLSDDYETWWARTVQPGAGNARGSMILPEVGDEVLVAFAAGDMGLPYVLGGLYNGKDKPPAMSGAVIDSGSGQVSRRGFVSRKGMSVELVEEAAAESVVLSTNAGAQKIVLTQTKSKGIQILSEGPVEVTTSTGDVTLKGMNVKIEAQTKLELKGVNVEITASASAKLAGAVTEVSASGPTTIKGALVRIN